MKREPLLDESYFDGAIAVVSSTIARFDDNLRLNRGKLKKPAVLTYSIFKYRYQLLLLRYSRGDSVSDLPDLLDETVTSLEQHLVETGGRGLMFDEDISDYTVALWLVSLAIVFESNEALVRRLVHAIGNAGKDALYDTLVRKRLPEHHPVAPGLMYPQPYQDLFLAVQRGSADDLIRFLHHWYGGLSGAYWHDCHLGPEGGGFFGYWAIEAVGVALACHIDDESFRDLPYYPKDLADFHRKHIP